MLREVEQLDKYMYSCNDIIISIAGSDEPITVEQQLIHSINIIKNFDDDIIPYISLSLQVDRDRYQLLQSSLDDISVTLSIDKYKLTDNNIKFKTNVLKGTFRAINQELLDPLVSGKIQEDLKDQQKNIAEDTLLIKLYLFDSNVISAYRIMMSNSITGTLTDLMYHTFQPRGISNVLMSPISSDIAEYNVEYGNLGDNLKFIDSIYGLYQAPYTLFLDFNATYLLDRGKIGQVVRELEYGNVNMYLEEYGSRESMDIGCYIDDENGQYIVNLNEVPKIVDIDNSMDYLSWSRLNYLVSGESYVDYTEAGNLGIEKAIVVNNIKVVDQQKFRVKENRRTMSMYLTDVDIDIITPNKKFILIADNKYNELYKLRGDYRLSNCVITFIKQGESDMNVTVSMWLNKQVE